ncbi:glycosyltransferase family 4 protein [Microbulbifer sp. S227A]|uniref:glycosyltransferase family 4 protein n=1 Tax=Microbulbifer sp. S227A TaxID=3415131 RepID=UPI003C7A64BD
MRPRVVHLVDDTTAGGVMRVLDFLSSSAALAEVADHEIRTIDRGRALPGRIGADIIVSHLAISWRALPMLLALRMGHVYTPLIHVEHSYTERFVALNVPRKRRFATLLKTSYALFNRVVAVSNGQRDWLLRQGHVRADRAVTIQSCVDLSGFRAVPATGKPLRVLGAIGRLDRQKGFDLAIRALRQMPSLPVELHFYGQGDQEPLLRELADGDGRIRFMGFAPDPVAAMASVDAVVMPSNWEAYGLVAIEALSARRPVLVNAIDGLLDHRQHGARVVPEMTVAAWSKAIREMAFGSLTLPQPDAPPDLERVFERKWNDLIRDLHGHAG